MPVKIFKALTTAEKEEWDKFLKTSRAELREVNKYLAKITESHERARRTQTEIDRLKKQTNAVLAKLT